jgi:hypothetical protein
MIESLAEGQAPKTRTQYHYMGAFMFPHAEPLQAVEKIFRNTSWSSVTEIGFSIM